MSDITVPQDSSNRQLSTFVFNGQTNIRAFRDNDGEPCFVAADVCKALDQSNVSQVVSRLDDDEKGLHIVDTPSGPQQMLCVSESGLYALILTSRKPEAKVFKRWITHEVLPAIRKTGQYTTQNLTPLQQLRLYLESAEAQQRQLTEHDQRLNLLEASVQRPPEYFTVLGYFRLRGFLPPSLNEAQSIGQRAAALSRRSGYSIGKTTDPRFGEVNTYHESVLKQIVGNN